MELLIRKLVWVAILVSPSLAFCPPFLAQERACTCFAYLDGAVIKCKGPSAPAAVEKLKAVQAEVRELWIEEANIVEIGPRAFRNLRIKTLVLDNNHIRSIHADAFRGLEDTLVSLSLAHNRLTEIPTDALMGMNSLLVLNLKCNSIGNLYNSAFRNVSRLIELNLACNQICKIAGPAFETVKDTVQSLILDQNCLKEIPAEALRNFKQLLALHLQYNAIASIEKLQLMNMVSLLMIRLTGNKIRSVDRYGFNNVPNLRYLFLDQNELVAVEPNTLQQFKFLEIVDLSYNNIAEITAGAFSGLEHLMQLNLEGNSIKDIAPAAFANAPLLLLMLGYNCLSAINQQMFQGIPFLRQLSLTNNNIRLVQPFSFNGLPNMHMLDLSANKIQAVQPTAITINPQTTVLLQENPMVCTQGGYHIIQGGQPTMLLSEANNVCKKDTPKESNSTVAEEDICPTRKEVPAAPACCSATAQSAVTSVTSSIERYLHQSTPVPQKSIFDLSSLLPSLVKATGSESTEPTPRVSIPKANKTEEQPESTDSENFVRFSSNHRLNMERFWRFTAAPQNRFVAPGLRAVPVTSPTVSLTNGQTSPNDEEEDDDQKQGGTPRPKVVPPGDAFDPTGLVTDISKTESPAIRRVLQHSRAPESRGFPRGQGPIQGKPEIQFNQDQQPQSLPNINVLPNIRQPVGGVNFQGVQPDPSQINGPQRFVPQQQRPIFQPNGQGFDGQQPPLQVPPGAQNGQNARPFQPNQQTNGQQFSPQFNPFTAQRPQGQQVGQGQQPPQFSFAPPAQKPQFSFGQPLPQGAQGAAPQFLAQPPRPQSPNQPQPQQQPISSQGPVQGPPRTSFGPPSPPPPQNFVPSQQRQFGPTGPIPQAPGQGQQHPQGNPTDQQPPASRVQPQNAPQATSPVPPAQPQDTTVQTDAATTSNPPPQPQPQPPAPRVGSPPGGASSPGQLPPSAQPPAQPQPPGAQASDSVSKVKSGSPAVDTQLSVDAAPQSNRSPDTAVRHH